MRGVVRDRHSLRRQRTRPRVAAGHDRNGTLPTMSGRVALSRSFDRTTMVQALRAATAAGEPLDLLVVGAGITGAGVALDAAARGLRVAVVERHDFASGTSSKSSKMVHGGLRYLQNGDVRLVYEALHERTRVMRNAPHLVETLPFLIPIMSRDGVVPRKVSRALGSALWAYDATGGWRIGRLHRRLSGAAAARYFPTARAGALSGGDLYFDAAADDARLTLAVARTAADRGAIVVNRAEVVDFHHSPGPAPHVATVAIEGEPIDVRSRAVVLAAGVWTDDVRALDEGRHPDSIRPAKGVHASVPWELVRNEIAVIVPIRSDRRSMFLVPWGRRPDGTFLHTYFGTTDSDYDGPLDAPACEGDDLDYLLTALTAAIDGTIDRCDVTGVWAGLRPLVAHGDDGESTTDLSRDHRVEVAASGVIRVTGGKLTTYRRMAEDTVDAVVEQLGGTRRQRRHRTRRLRLHGADAGRPPRDDRLGHRYGTDAPHVRALVALDADLGEPLVPGQSYVRAEAVYAARAEMATTVEDVLCRRTRAHLFDRDACRQAAPQVADLLSAELGWDAAERERQLISYLDLCAAEERALEHHAHAAH
jgi:glycerol-3-phosphate dehydrogenase